VREGIERVLLTVWVGGMWVVGYLVAPTLFAILKDKVLAGTIAGHLFTVMSYVGLISGVLLLVSLFLDAGIRLLQQWRGPVLIGMLAIICLGQFLLQPRMAALRDTGLSGDNLHAFMRLHGISQILFLLVSLGGLALVMFGLRRKKST
jgi:MFS family permease